MGGLGEREEEAPGHLVERGAAWVLHLDNTRYFLVDTAHSAHLHAP